MASAIKVNASGQEMRPDLEIECQSTNDECRINDE
jgi:hypothetical protein